jgi:hypothetical protein
MALKGTKGTYSYKMGSYIHPVLYENDMVITIERTNLLI